MLRKYRNSFCNKKYIRYSLFTFSFIFSRHRKLSGRTTARNHHIAPSLQYPDNLRITPDSFSLLQEDKNTNKFYKGSSKLPYEDEFNSEYDPNNNQYEEKITAPNELYK